MDMTNGPIFGKIVVFTLPLLFSGILQLLYNAADLVVVGRFAGDAPLAAVGATGALINLLVNLFLGLSVGIGVLVARYYGAKDDAGMERAVHTSLLAGLISGVAIGIIGFILTRPLLILMDTPDDVIDLATLYMRIYFCGMPASMIYNFGSAILRSTGDTRRPLLYLAISGILNVFLNLFFVLAMGMDVDGVALGTVASQLMSAVLVVRCLMKEKSAIRFVPRHMRICKAELLVIVKIGLPAGIQGSIFSISNVLIQSSINSFGKVAIAGNTAASNLEGFVYVAMNALYQAALTFVGQNYGAHKPDRIIKVTRQSLLMVTVVGIVLSGIVLLLGRPLLSIYSDQSAVIDEGMIRLEIICTTYFLCGLMDVSVGVLRGLGRSFLPMVISIAGICGIRILWIYTVFASTRSLRLLYVSYPVSWIVTMVIQGALMLAALRRVKRELAGTAEPVPQPSMAD